MRVTAFFLSCLLLFSHQALAKTEQNFNIKRAENTLKSAQSLIDRKYVPFKRLANARDQLESAIESAKACSARQESKLESIKKVKLSLGIKANDAFEATDSADIKYIKKRAQRVMQRLGNCRLYLLKADTVLTEYQERLATGAKQRMWKRGSPIWSLAYKNFSKELHLFKADYYLDLSMLSSYTVFEFTYLLVFTAVIIVVGGSVHQHYLKGFSLPRQWIVLTAFAMSFLSLLFYTVPYADLTTLMGNLSLYGLLMMSVIVLSQTKSFDLLASWFSLNPTYLKSLCKTILHLVIFYQILLIGVRWQNIPDLPLQLAIVSIVSAIYVAIIMLFRGVINQIKDVEFINQHRWAINNVILAVLGIGLVMNLLGYGVIANYLAVNSIATFVYLVIFTLFYRITNGIFFYLNNKKSRIHQRLHRHLGVRLGQSVFEINLLSYLVLASGTITLIYFTVGLWDLSKVTDDHLFNLIVDGFVIANMHILPLDLTLGLAVFCFLNMLCRVIATKMSQGEKKSRVIISNSSGVAQLIYYIGSSISILLALFVAGISLTGIAIVAGALSVGIGLGLKSIVNNFIAGIILLIEKPIKIGDFITINDVTGTVKGIGARSTHIVTRQRVEVIVPNEDLITTQVSNFMFEQPVLRLDCPVGVAYGSDLKLVEKLLLEVAAQNPNVINDDPNRRPKALLIEFGDSSIDFELRVVITDVPSRYIIRSQLLFAMYDQFKKHNIEIPFPQVVFHKPSESSTDKS